MSNLAPVLFCFSVLNSENIYISAQDAFIHCDATSTSSISRPFPTANQLTCSPHVPLQSTAMAKAIGISSKSGKKERPLQKTILLLPFSFVSISRNKASHCLGAHASDPGWLNARLSWLFLQLLPRHWCVFSVYTRGSTTCLVTLSFHSCLAWGQDLSTKHARKTSVWYASFNF